MPLTDYPWCDFIQMGYFVHVVARTHSFYDDIVVKLPIVVQSKDVSKVDAVGNINFHKIKEHIIKNLTYHACVRTYVRTCSMCNVVS